MRELRLGPIGFGFYARIAWQRATVRPGGLVHSLNMLILPPDTAVATVWDTILFRQPPAAHPLWRWIVEGARRNLVEHPQFYVAISQAVRQELHDHLGVPLEKVRVASPGVDTDLFHPRADPRPAAMPRDGKTTVLHVGMGYRRKGIDQLVEALGALGPSRFRLVRAGPPKDPDYVASYQARARELGLDLVEAGYLTDETLARFYSNADLLVFPSLDEGAGIPPLEAMACGTNVVLTDLPAHREMCGELGFYAAPNLESLAFAIEDALTHPRSPDELERMARSRSWARTAEVYIQLYSELGVRGVH